MNRPVLFFITALLVVAHHAGAQAPTDSLLIRAEMKLDQGEPGEAAALYRQILRADERDVAGYIGLGRVELAEGHWDRAGDHFDRALKIAPDDTAAHYYRAIAFRELARIRTIFQQLHWSGAEEHFEWVIRRDSLYRDVLYQYALLRRYHEAFPEALRLGRRQVALRPDLYEAQQGLFKLYRSFITRTNLRGVEAALSNDTSGYAAFALAEKYRREDQPEEAEKRLLDLLDRPPTIPRQPLWLALARVNYARGDDSTGQRYVEKAIDGIADPPGAAFVFDDAKYILTPPELERYRRMSAPDSFRTFFHTLWLARDPLPSSPVNARLTEHYRRLLKAEKDFWFDGLRTWHNSPDRLHELQYPPAYRLNDEFNDKGLVYIRYGEPDEREFRVTATSLPNDSWRYRGKPPLDLHFVVARDAVGNNWRLAPVIMDPAIVENLQHWGGVYTRLAGAHSPLELEQYRNEWSEQSRDAVSRVMTTDRHTWPDSAEALEWSFLTASFRADSGRTRLEMHYYAPPKVPFARRNLETGAAVLSRAWKRLGWKSAVHRQDADRMAVSGFFAFDLPPDTYRVALHARSLGGPEIGGFKQEYALPSYAGSGLDMSDILPARHIGPLLDGPYHRCGLQIEPAVDGRFRTGRPLFVYMEVYGFEPAQGPEARYNLAVRLTPVNRKRGFLGLFRPSRYRPVLTLETERFVAESCPSEYVELDVRNVDPGMYTLTVQLTDVRSGRTVDRSRTVTLIP